MADENKGCGLLVIPGALGLGYVVAKCRPTDAGNSLYVANEAAKKAIAPVFGREYEPPADLYNEKSTQPVQEGPVIPSNFGGKKSYQLPRSQLGEQEKTIAQIVQETFCQKPTKDNIGGQGIGLLLGAAAVIATVTAAKKYFR